MPSTASKVDFPAPEGPMMETNSPGLMSKVMRRRTYILPAGVSKTFSRSRRLISGTPGGIGTCSATADGLEEKNTVRSGLGFEGFERFEKVEGRACKPLNPLKPLKRSSFGS